MFVVCFLTKSKVSIGLNWERNDSGLPGSLSHLDIDVSAFFFNRHLTKDFTMCYRLPSQYKNKNEFTLSDIEANTQ